MGRVGIEPTPSGFSDQCSDLISYLPITSNEVPLVFSGLAQRAKLGRLEGTSIGGNWSQWRCLRELNPYARAENSKSLPLDESTNFYLFYLMYILYHKFLKKSKIFFGARGRIRTCDNGVADRGLNLLTTRAKKCRSG